MSKASKVKNPCKICMKQVTQRTGLQCSGACHKWVHYSCLNYTPGKIQDIKAGIIKITCPCPDCRSPTANEYRTDEPYSCTNIKCPANQPPPANRVDTGCSSNRSSQMMPIKKCGSECKTHKVSTQTCAPAPCVVPYCMSSDYVCGDKKKKEKGGGNLPLETVEQMCHTVGQLTNQINELMCRMREAMNSGCGMEPAPCPCHCPSNPGRR